MMGVPNAFLPPPLLKKIGVRGLIFLGNLTGRGYWFWNMATNTLYWNGTQCRVYGMKECKGGCVGTYEDLFERHLATPDDKAAVRRSVEFALRHRRHFYNHFAIIDQTTGKETIIAAKGTWLFDNHSDEPWAMWGWNERVHERQPQAVLARNQIAMRRMAASGGPAETHHFSPSCHATASS